MTAKAGKDGEIQVTGQSTSMSNEPMTDTGNGTLFVINDDAKNVFDPSVSFTVEVDSGGGFNPVSPSNYDLRYLVGAVDFDTNQSGNDVRISGSYLPRYTLVEAYEVSPEFSKESLDATTFGSSAIERLSGLKDFSVDVSSYEVRQVELDQPANSNEATLEEIFQGAETRGGSGDISEFVVFSYRISRTSSLKFRARVFLTDESLETPVDDLAGKNVTFQVVDTDPAMSTQTFEAIRSLNS
jgi:hypothetical protein